MKKHEKVQKGQLNNSGFSLLEVLIAIVILCIVSIPLLHSFVTTAKTNARAKIMLRATTAAENLMEDFKYLTLDELTAKYGASSLNSVVLDDTTGKYTFTIKNQSDFSQNLPEGYSVTMVLDPTLYPNANALNLSDFSTVSAADSAVYTMSAQYDQSAYDEFARRSEEANTDNPLQYTRQDADYFKEKLSRTITVSIVKKDTATDELGENVDIVSVNLRIVYELKNYSGILPSSEKKYEVTNAEIYNNTITKTPLSSVFVLYNPRYLSAVLNKGDNIVVENIDNVKANLYVVAQEGAADDSYRTQYLSKTNGLRLTVVENPKGSDFPNSTSGALTLRTNLNSGAPYSGLSGTDGEILCVLTYQNLIGSLKATDKKAQTILHTGDVDGKTLQADQTKTRIYKVITTVYDDKPDIVVQLDGTRLN